MMMIGPIESYLLGLICGRGHFLPDNTLVIEFAHKNPVIHGIAHCPKCGNFASEKKIDNPDGDLICKGCNSKVDKSLKKKYEQKNSTVQSIENVIVPFLRNRYNFSYKLLLNDHVTLFVMILDEKDYHSLILNFNDKTSYDSFLIPKIIYQTEYDNKLEFLNGILDTAGFFNSGGWLFANDKQGFARMRCYIQIVRNWKLPVQICNFLQCEMDLPIQTIDWGHPNIRDSNLHDYYNSSPTGWTREHQIKFFPEYYQDIKLRIDHKQQMFNELLCHNIKYDYSDYRCNNPSKITIGKIKPYHPGEEDIRLPQELRTHFDAFWQICHKQNCKITNFKIASSNNPDNYFLSGEDVNSNYSLELTEATREELTIQCHNKYVNKIEFRKKQLKNRRNNNEASLYEPISKWLYDYLIGRYNQDVSVHITSESYLDSYIIKNDLIDYLEFYEDLKIKPDIVGFLKETKEIIFVEVKVGELSIQDIGQLIGYSLVGLPKESILISPLEPSINLKKILNIYPEILKFGNNTINVGRWKNNQCIFG